MTAIVKIQFSNTTWALIAPSWVSNEIALSALYADITNMHLSQIATNIVKFYDRLISPVTATIISAFGDEIIWSERELPLVLVAFAIVGRALQVQVERKIATERSIFRSDIARILEKLHFNITGPLLMWALWFVLAFIYPVFKYVAPFVFGLLLIIGTISLPSEILRRRRDSVLGLPKITDDEYEILFNKELLKTLSEDEAQLKKRIDRYFNETRRREKRELQDIAGTIAWGSIVFVLLFLLLGAYGP